jgi:3-deoxy-D-manno-octulosonate 8-phosphate phosphatase (KDO 8-P phosphatase)
MQSYKERLSDLKALVFDIDGVLTDGKVQVNEQGELIRTLNAKDGYAIQYAAKMGITLAIITGSNAEKVGDNLIRLGFKKVYLKSGDKLSVMQKFLNDFNLEPSQVAYMGDDIPDIKALEYVSVSTCPNDAVPEVRKVCDYVSHKNGGEGCVRDLIEQTLKAKNLWLTEQAYHW